MKPSSDADLMIKMRNGDREAFAQVIDRYRDEMVNYLCRLTGSRAKAEDLTQEAFLRLYERAGSYNEMGKLSGFLYRIATNLARSEQRRENRRRILSLAFLQGNNGTVTTNPHHQLCAKETHQKLAEAIKKVPWRFRVPLVLYEIQGLSYLEIGKIMSCGQGTIKSRINRSRNLLRKMLSGYFHGGV